MASTWEIRYEFLKRDIAVTDKNVLAILAQLCQRYSIDASKITCEYVAFTPASFTTFTTDIKKMANTKLLTGQPPTLESLVFFENEKLKNLKHFGENHYLEPTAIAELRSKCSSGGSEDLVCDESLARVMAREELKALDVSDDDGNLEYDKSEALTAEHIIDPTDIAPPAKKRKVYSAEEKAEAVKLCVEGKITPQILSQEKGLSPSTIYLWIKKAGLPLPPKQPFTHSKLLNGNPSTPSKPQNRLTDYYPVTPPKCQELAAIENFPTIPLDILNEKLVPGNVTRKDAMEVNVIRLEDEWLENNIQVGRPIENGDLKETESKILEQPIILDNIPPSGESSRMLKKQLEITESLLRSKREELEQFESKSRDDIKFLENKLKHEKEEKKGLLEKKDCEIKMMKIELIKLKSKEEPAEKREEAAVKRAAEQVNEVEQLQRSNRALQRQLRDQEKKMTEQGQKLAAIRQLAEEPDIKEEADGEYIEEDNGEGSGVSGKR